MEQRVARLEEQNRAQEAAIQRQEATITQQKQMLEGAPGRVKKLGERIEEKRSEEVPSWFNRIEIAGLIEVEAGYHSPFEGDSESDIVLATFELGIAAQVTEWVEAAASLLYEEDETDLEVDVAFITIANFEASPVFFTGGQIYVPFGAYETNLVSDPLTLEIGETRETTAQLGFVYGDFSGSAYVFNGDEHDIKGDNQIGSWGANLAYAHEEEDRAWAFGVGYINDLGESDSLGELISDNRQEAHDEGVEVDGFEDGWLSTDPTERIGGWTANAAGTFSGFTVIGEYLSATEKFNRYSLSFKDRGAKPSAWNIELGYTFDIQGYENTVAVAYQGTDEALALELPKERLLVGWSIGIFDNTSLSLEYAHDKDYGTGEGGTGKNADTVTAQLAVEF